MSISIQYNISHSTQLSSFLLRLSHMLRSWTYGLTNFENWKARCLLFHFLSLMSHRWLILSLSFSCYLMTLKMFSEGKLSQAGQQNQQSSGIKPSYSKTSHGFEYKKNCTNKLSIKMFIKRKTMAEGLCFPNSSEF